MRMDVSSNTVNCFKWLIHEARCYMSVGNSTITVTTTKTTTEIVDGEKGGQSLSLEP